MSLLTWHNIAHIQLHWKEIEHVFAFLFTNLQLDFGLKFEKATHEHALNLMIAL